MTYTESHPTVFNYTTTDAQVGDFFQLSFQPSAKVLSRADLGDYVAYIVKIGDRTEAWDLLKPEAGLQEQERNRIEADEAEMSAVIHSTATEEFEVYLAGQYDWLTEPIGASLDAIFGVTGEQMAEYLPPVKNAYHDTSWTGKGCEF